MADSLSLRDQLIESTIGLSRVCSMHKKSARTDTIQNTTFLIKSEKSKIAPMCETCAARCGNSDDYDMSKLYNASDEIRKLKLAILHKIQGMAKDAILKLRSGKLDDQAVIYFHKCLFAISEDWDATQLSEVLHEDV